MTAAAGFIKTAASQSKASSLNVGEASALEEETSLSARGGNGVHLFGIRHLSPAGAVHLRAFLDRIKPTLILVEGPSDASSLIGQLTLKGVKPPVAILAYTDSLPVRTVLFPLAEYSPEYQAFVWAAEHSAEARFIDLPSGVAVSLHSARQEERERIGEQLRNHYRTVNDGYERIAELAGEPDYETYWERSFEHTSDGEAYRQSLHELSAQMRELTEWNEREQLPLEAAGNAIREAYMLSRIHAAIAEGHAPEQIVVVTGAYHVSALQSGVKGMTEQEAKQLPSRTTKLTLMPYSYYRLSSRSGYGAGNAAPYYFEQAWQCMAAGDKEKLSSLYLSSVSRHMRQDGQYRSTASVIEAVRLAEALAAMHGGSAPSLKDLHDAAVACLGNGELSVVAEAIARADVGTAIGSLPEGVSQTPLQDDLSRQLKQLKLAKYKSGTAQELALDLRENRRVKSEEAAFIDLRRSFFLHRLQWLGISFARRLAVRQEGATWAEQWTLRWTPEAEIETVESTLKGETIELAAAFLIRERLEQSVTISEAAALVRTAWECGMPASLEDARSILQQLAADAGDLSQLAATLRELSMLIQFGDVRKIDTGVLVPLLQQLFLRSTLLLVDAAACSDEAATGLAAAVIDLHAVARQHDEQLDDERWVRELEQLAYRDDRNAKLSGLAFALLLERNLIESGELSREVSRRLSPGIPADIGAGWFEGMSLRNRYVLLSRKQLWEQLDAYIHSLDDEQFIRALVFLRRAFGTFEAREKNMIAELLGDVWGLDALETGDALQQPLSESEQEQIDELNEFDFGDF